MPLNMTHPLISDWMCTGERQLHAELSVSTSRFPVSGLNELRCYSFALISLVLLVVATSSCRSYTRIIIFKTFRGKLHITPAQANQCASNSTVQTRLLLLFFMSIDRTLTPFPLLFHNSRYISLVKLLCGCDNVLFSGLHSL